MEEWIYNRFEEIAQKMNNNRDYAQAKQQITNAYEQIKEKDPELYRNAILENIDPALSCIESEIMTCYYQQGFKDALELTELLRK